MKRIFCIVAGLICLAAGLVGLALPIIPQVPFLLLAAFLLARGSDRFRRWLANSWLSKYLGDAKPQWLPRWLPQLLDEP